MIDGVVIKRLVRHDDERGFFMEILRDDDDMLRRFGQTSYTRVPAGCDQGFSLAPAPGRPLVYRRRHRPGRTL